jgi:hypothetical protein
MDIVRRVQDILLKPKDTWPVIDAEPTDVGSLYRSYIAILAAIPALAMFIGLSLIGVGGFGVSYRVPFVSGLVSMIVNYVLTLGMVYVVALIVEALAPTFGGSKNRLQALKVVAYGSTASFVGGIFYLIPSLSPLALLAALYSIYLFYLGLPMLMKCPQDKAIGYTVVVGIVAIVAGVVIGAIAAAVTPGAGFGRYGAASGGEGALSIKTPQGEVKLDTAQMEAAARQMQAAAERMQQSATGAVSGAASVVGGAGLAAQQLKALLPESVGDLKRESVEAVGDGQSIVTAAHATYRNGERSLSLSITDVGGGLGAAAAMWSMVTMDREADGEVEKIYKDGKRSVHEKARKDGSEAEMQVILANGTMVGAEGQGMDLKAVKAALAAMDLGKVEALARPAVAKQ